MEEAKPVVLTKPIRGRELLSKKGPLERVAPGGSSEQNKGDQKKVETYYEGFVDGQLFLVPDSNLEAMKDMINFKMRPKTSIRYKHQTSYDIQYYDQFNEKLNELLTKLDDFQESADIEESGSRDKTVKMPKEIEPQEKIPEESEGKTNLVESEIMKELENKYALEDSNYSSSSTSVKDELRIRFLISGHFKDGKTPIYIVQDYEGINDIFKDQKVDFTSFQENSQSNIFISGKLYSEDILVESEGDPLFLNTKPEKIAINDKKSKIFINSFEHVFEKEDHRIILRGKFINGKNGQITPSLALFIKEKITSSKSVEDLEGSLQE